MEKGHEALLRLLNARRKPSESFDDDPPPSQEKRSGDGVSTNLLTLQYGVYSTTHLLALAFDTELCYWRWCASRTVGTHSHASAVDVCDDEASLNAISPPIMDGGGNDGRGDGDGDGGGDGDGLEPSLLIHRAAMGVRAACARRAARLMAPHRSLPLPCISLLPQPLPCVPTPSPHSQGAKPVTAGYVWKRRDYLLSPRPTHPALTPTPRPRGGAPCPCRECHEAAGASSCDGTTCLVRISRAASRLPPRISR